MEVYLGTICPFSFGIIPYGWAACNGAKLPIKQFGTLYSLLKIKFGGDNEYFNLPDLSGRMAIGAYEDNQGKYPLGNAGGSATIKLTEEQTAHAHNVTLSIQAVNLRPDTTDPTGNYPALCETSMPYTGRGDGAVLKPLINVNLQTAGSGAEVNIMKPNVGMNYCMCMAGEFPKRRQ